MTDTTDIAALMLKMRNLADRIIDAEGENNNGEVGKIIEMYDAADTTFKAENILLVLSAFETERQRVAEITGQYVDRTTALSFASQRAEKAEARVGVLEGVIDRKEFDALKVDQVPVALVDERQGSGGFCLTQHGKRLNLPHGTELFTAPQKPVVLPKSHYVCGCADRFMSEPEVRAAIEAAGGIVKDGE